jgi:hypothetical protein
MLYHDNLVITVLGMVFLLHMIVFNSDSGSLNPHLSASRARH